MYSPFYKFLIKQHLLKKYPYPTTVRNTVIGLMIKNRNNITIPLHEKYETIDFTPKNKRNV